ncbi:hypothetical protein AQUCO_01300865v1 [Aquilegia coerulea]|uniref:Uncharacterized protein n=1 Tax=Aquilegia coerulea TaxID=218851 RepID=A0A2G5E3Q4_AQUCA|nr:hypothetical protein AQUCO_01300865v1 [Aquilegia coerulea]
MSNYGRKASAKVEEIDEVEELLRATEDDMLLKLSVGSHHISRTSSSSLDQDLIRRFEALKTPSVSKTITNVPPMEGSSRSQLKEKKKDGDGGDMFTRFSTLKNGSCSGSSDSMMESSSEMSKVRSDGGDGNTSSNHEDEVSKVIQWAIDAARLDPSLSDDDESNDDDDNDDDSESDDVEDEEENDNVKRKPCKSGSGSGSGSKKKKPSKS